MNRLRFVLDLLKQHPEGLNAEQIKNMGEFKSKKVVTNLMYQLKQKYPLVPKHGFYKLKSNQPEDSIEAQSNDLSKQTKSDDILQSIIEAKEGITRGELIRKYHINGGDLSGRIFHLRNKGYKILTVKDSYFYKQDETKVIPNTIKNKPAKKNTLLTSSNLIPKEFHDTFLNLSESDKIDCIDMLRKSIYYHKSAISLLESNKTIQSFVASIEGGF